MLSLCMFKILFLKTVMQDFFCQSLNMLHTSLYIFSNSNNSIVAISELQQKRQKLKKQDKQVNRRTKTNKAYGYELL